VTGTLRTLLPAAAVLLFTAAAVAQNSGPPSPALTAASNLVAAINGSEADRRAFAAAGYAAGGSETADVRAAFLDKLHADSGGLNIVTIKADNERLAEATIVSRRGERFARLVVITSATEPGKIARHFVFPARDPAKLKAEAWPDTPVPVTQLPKEIAWRLDRLATDDAFSGVVLVADGDRVLFREGYGFANQVWRAPNRPDTAFHAASVTKMLTAAAILKLAEQGRLSLDDSLAKWVPEYPQASAAARITLRHLLTHTSGLPPWEVRQLARSTAQLVRTMTTAPSRAPGERFEYSNAGFVLLGAVIENVTKMDFEQALKALVMEPAGMTRTAAWPVSAVIPNRATGYLLPQDDPLGAGPRYANDQYLGFKGDGSGGLYTTADDLFAFHRAVVNGTLLGPAAKEQFLAAATDFPGTPRPSKYGLGMRLTECSGQPVFGHSGGGANSGISNATFTTLDGRWTVIVLSNYDVIGEQVAQELCDVVARTSTR
jgi:D-alanyl-D-alanine carboxypeptidase